MSECCELRKANDIHSECDGEDCVYWRAVGHLAISDEEAGCAIQAFRMLDGGQSDVAAWLLSVKDRVEAERAAGRRASA